MPLPHEVRAGAPRTMKHLLAHSEQLNIELVGMFAVERALFVSRDEQRPAGQTASEVVDA